MSIKLKISEEQYLMLQNHQLEKSGAIITMDGKTYKNLIQHTSPPKILDIYKSTK